MSLSLVSLPIFCCKTHLNPYHGHPSQRPKPNLAATSNIPCINANNQTSQPATIDRAKYWDNDYIKSLPNHYAKTTNKMRVEELKKSVRGLLAESVDDPLAKLDYVDTITKLGVGHHFKDEIKSVVDGLLDPNFFLPHDLYATSLVFRLLRQYGHNFPSDIFTRFKDKTGNFKACLVEDVRGLLSLYEASHLGFEGELIMDEGKAFARKHLTETTGNVNASALAKKVAYSIELPFCRRVPRAEARWYIDIYESEEKMKPPLLELAKLDYNMVQAIYQQELANVVRWWEDLGLQHLGFVREKMMINFVWSLGMSSAPQYGHLREEMTKLCIILTVIDDMYDSFDIELGELELFTSSIERWDVSTVAQLPQYMRLCYKALLNTTDRIGYEILKTHSHDITAHQKKAWGKLCTAYLLEASRLQQGYTPTSKEYFGSAVYSIGMQLVLLNYYFLTANKITRDALDWIENMQSLIYYPALIFRLANDMGTFTDKEKKGSVQVYMHEQGVSEEVAREHVRELISNLWKKLNKAIVCPHPFSDAITSAALTLCQLSHFIFIYEYEDGNVDSTVSFDDIMSLVFEPIPLE